MEYYLGIKKKKILPFAATWMDLESIMLSEISQRREKFCILSLMWTLKIYKSNEYNKKKADPKI